jgi:hypothetical protein
MSVLPPPPPPTVWKPIRRWRTPVVIGGLALLALLAVPVAFVIAWSFGHQPLWDNDLVRVSARTDDATCFVAESRPGSEWCVSREHAEPMEGIAVGMCARIDSDGETFGVASAAPAACPADTSALTPEVAVTPGEPIGTLTSRGLDFDFRSTRSDFGRWCAGATVSESERAVNTPTYEDDPGWWVCGWRRPEMNALGDPEVEAFEDFDGLAGEVLIMGWVPDEIATVTIGDGDELVEIDTVESGGRFGTRMTQPPEDWTLVATSHAGEAWECSWIPDGPVTCRR